MFRKRTVLLGRFHDMDFNWRPTENIWAKNIAEKKICTKVYHWISLDTHWMHDDFWTLPSHRSDIKLSPLASKRSSSSEANLGRRVKGWTSNSLKRGLRNSTAFNGDKVQLLPGPKWWEVKKTMVKHWDTRTKHTICQCEYIQYIYICTLNDDMSYRENVNNSYQKLSTEYVYFLLITKL